MPCSGCSALHGVNPNKKIIFQGRVFKTKTLITIEILVDIFDKPNISCFKQFELS